MSRYERELAKIRQLERDKIAKARYANNPELHHLSQHIGNEEAELRRVYYGVHENIKKEDKGPRGQSEAEFHRNVAATDHLFHDPYYTSSKKNIGGKE